MHFAVMVAIRKSEKNHVMIFRMGTVNKQSVREEVERIKIEFDQLVTGKKMSTESRVLFQSTLMLINLLISIFLERTTPKNNKNSSTSSSQTAQR
jgi:transposase